MNISFTNINEPKNLKFCVLTDKNFLIKSFTANCLENLKLQYKFINSNYFIINYIKQFQEDYLLNINNENDNKSFIKKNRKSVLYLDKYFDISDNTSIQFLNKILKNYINKKKIINWAIKDEIEEIEEINSTKKYLEKNPFL